MKVTDENEINSIVKRETSQEFVRLLHKNLELIRLPEKSFPIN